MSKIKITCVFKWTRTEEVGCSMGAFVSTTRFSVWLACERGKGSDSIYGETADTTVEECVCVCESGGGGGLTSSASSSQPAAAALHCFRLSYF